MAGKRTRLLTVGVGYYAESGIAGCLSLAFAAARQNRAHPSGHLLCWLPGHRDRERVTAFLVAGSARRPAGRLDRRDTFCYQTIRGTLSAWRGLGACPGIFQQFGY